MIEKLLESSEAKGFPFLIDITAIFFNVETADSQKDRKQQTNVN